MNIRTAILGFLALLFIILLIPVLVFCFFLQFQAPVFAWSKAFIFIARRVAGLRVTVSGRRLVLPGRQYIFMANHQSFIDGPLLFGAIPGRVRVILKKEVFRIPVVGPTMRFVGFISVDRKGIKSGRRSLERAADFMACRGYSYLVFPEGTRSRDGRLQPLKRGGFFLALKSGAPIVPVTIQGTFALMPRGSLFVRPGSIRVSFQAPIPVKGYGVEAMPALMDKVGRAFASGLETKESG